MRFFGTDPVALPSLDEDEWDDFATGLAQLVSGAVEAYSVAHRVDESTVAAIQYGVRRTVDEYLRVCAHDSRKPEDS